MKRCYRREGTRRGDSTGRLEALGGEAVLIIDWGFGLLYC